MEIEKGKLLVSEPNTLGDHSFSRSVILLTEHNDDGSVGFILNKPLDLKLSDVMDIPGADYTLHRGGPVQLENLYFIHTVPEMIPGSNHIGNDVYWGGDFQQLQTLISQNEIPRDSIRFFLGYSGWSPEQLSAELEKKTWVLIRNEAGKDLLSIDDLTQWKEEMNALGGKYSIWSNAPDNPNLN